VAIYWIFHTPEEAKFSSATCFAHLGVNIKGNHWPLCGQSGVCVYQFGRNHTGACPKSCEAAAQNRAGPVAVTQHAAASAACWRYAHAGDARGGTQSGRCPMPHTGRPWPWLGTTGAYEVPHESSAGGGGWDVAPPAPSPGAAPGRAARPASRREIGDSAANGKAMHWQYKYKTQISWICGSTCTFNCRHGDLGPVAN
jgi:hypothetical protein